MILLKRFRSIPAVILMVLAFISCDDDFHSIGGELVGGQIDALPKYDAGVVAYSKKLPPVQTNNLPLHLLGVYNGPVYGSHTANVLTQLSLPSGNPSFGNRPRLDSVVLTLPYFSTRLEADEQGNNVYRLDSVYGNSPIKLTVSRTNYFINDFDPDANFENRQRYYSDKGAVFENSIIGDPLYENDSFVPSTAEVSFREPNQTGVLDTVTVAPRLRVHLPLEFFQENIIDREGSTELFNNNNFRNFIRGLYFKAEPINDDGTMMLLNFRDSNAGIILYYTNTIEEEGEEDVLEENSFKLNFGPNLINTYSQELSPQIEAGIQASNEETGGERLYLKGGQGSMAVIDLFDEEELEELRSRDWLINEANLTFYVDQATVQGGSTESENIYLYDLTTNQPLSDFYSGRDQSGNLIRNPIHAPVLERDEDANGIFYKIRITSHIREILEGNTDNVKLGLVVTQNTGLINPAALRTPVGPVSQVPIGSVLTPRGTILHGNLSSNEDKRLKFNIYYTDISN
ncbi:DUF4270 domain-containing protein [Antarcticibacterium flavum]|uniref:DUF4270 domain-containing protein n=1 Tax=Antarcticibacterium flavum TaxID=2058175 RepID=A0A5B7X413_9FLAO|nr:MULTISPECIES: DUF4270 domain-containing protein [Antarcticibacterium]MCM4160543.1 DUF4270 domain-containing protein [Antarcticibacterium sp. W02-3]QCY69795.1 DUF4270 domain-containing protein [Antarcticibacterium flavum]